jgi:monoamine oxidase
VACLVPTFTAFGQHAKQGGREPGCERRGIDEEHRHERGRVVTVDVVVVGAGAAGIGAGLELAARGVSFVMIEAADRVGGRAFTDRTSLPHGWDQGCHWLHCADANPLVAWAERLGATYRREVWTNHFVLWSRGAWLDAAGAAAARGHLAAAFEAIEAFSATEGPDLPVSAVVPDAGRWAAATRYILTLLEAEEPERVSARGYADYDDTGVNWPVISGYGDLFAAMAAGLPVKLGVAASAVHQEAGRVRIETGQGTLVARAAIVTASTGVLLSGAIRFGAGPAREALDLMADVPIGAYEKVAIALRRRIVDDPEKLFCMVDPGEGASPVEFQIASSGEPLMIAHMAGELARGLSAEGEAAMTDFALERLALAFGADVRREVVATAVTGWQANPFVRGGYSYARPGTAQKRHALIAADTGNVAFAGEAQSRRWQATAHGAYRSGRDVAARMAEQVLAGA